jgi:predicted adenylyl cyclase CyaB
MEKEKTIAAYNRDAEKLAVKFKNLLELHRRHEFQRFIELLKGKNILDLGCGAGDHSQYFIQQGLDVTAIDLSEKMVELCKNKGLNAQIMDIENLQFPDNSFDGIWAVTSLLHIEKGKLAPVIKKLHKIIKPEGLIFVCMKEGVGSEVLPDGRFFEYWQEEQLKEHFTNFQHLETTRESLGHNNFLQMLFQKKPANIEVEIRTFISEGKYNQLKLIFQNNWQFISKDNQITHYFDTKQDLRIQKNDFYSKIWLKKGQIHDDQREEIEIKCDKKDFQTLRKLFAALGHQTEIEWYRKRLTFELDDIKAMLDHTEGYGYILELEKMSTTKEQDQTLQLLQQKMQELNIEITPKDKFKQQYQHYKENWKELTNHLPR